MEPRGLALSREVSSPWGQLGGLQVLITPAIRSSSLASIREGGYSHPVRSRAAT